MRKRWRFMTVMLAAACVVTSCGGNHVSSENEEGITLTLMGKESDLEKSYMKKIFEQYETSTGNRLEIISYEDADYETSASQKFADGNIPDIFMHFNNADLKRYDVEDNFYYLNDEDWVDDLTDNVHAYCQDGDGNLLGLPFWENSISGCYYNKTILDSLGLKPATTQAEFDVLCQALADIGYTPICWPADGCAWMIQFALDPVFADDPSLLERLNQNKITYADIPEVSNMVQWIADAADKGWFGTDFMETGWVDISPAMSSGKAVMTFIWDTWFYTDMTKDGKYSIDDFALMPVFLNTVDSGTYEGGNLNMMMANKNSDQLDAVLEFLDFCASRENYNVAFDGISTVNCFKGQTTNIQSHMVTDASVSVDANVRISTAASKIVGYSADDMVTVVNDLFHKRTDVPGCVKLMDDYRVSEAKKQGIDGF